MAGHALMDNGKPFLSANMLIFDPFTRLYLL